MGETDSRNDREEKNKKEQKGNGGGSRVAVEEGGDGQIRNEKRGGQGIGRVGKEVGNKEEEKEEMLDAE